MSQINKLKCPVVNATDFREKYALERGSLLHDLLGWPRASDEIGGNSGIGTRFESLSGSGSNDATGNEMDDSAVGQTDGKYYFDPVHSRSRLWRLTPRLILR